MAPTIYIDTSALIKVVIKEEESESLIKYLTGREARASSALIVAEMLRATRLHDPEAIAAAEDALTKLAIIDVSSEVLVAAGMLNPLVLRTLDAIHLATAQLLLPELENIVTYDRRMVEAAAQLSLPTVSPR